MHVTSLPHHPYHAHRGMSESHGNNQFVPLNKEEKTELLGAENGAHDDATSSITSNLDQSNEPDTRAARGAAVDSEAVSRFIYSSNKLV
jgi:hypothetical protein